MNLKKITCLSVLCAGVCAQSYATDYMYTFEGPVTFALTITGQGEPVVKETDTSYAETLKSTARKFTNKELIAQLGYDDATLEYKAAAKVMVRTSEEGEGENEFFIRYKDVDGSNIDDVIDLAIEENADYGTGTGKSTWAAEGKAVNDTTAASRTWTSHVNIAAFGLSLYGIAVESDKFNYNYKEDLDGNPTAFSMSLTETGKVTVNGYSEDSEVVTGTISYSIKTIKTAILE